MSHVVTITDVVFNDIEALKAAVKSLQQKGVRCSLIKDAVARAYYVGQIPKSDYVLKLDDAQYDVALFYDKEKKGLIAKTDFFAGSVQQVLGAPTKAGESQAQANMGKLYHAYARCAATRQAVRQGYTVRTVEKPDGSCQLILSGMAA